MAEGEAGDASKPVLVLFRNDLRVADNRALVAAAQSGKPVMPVFIWDEKDGSRPLGGAARWWLHHSLQKLSEKLADLGSGLCLRHGPAHETVTSLLKETGADTVLWNRRYDPPAAAADASLKKLLRKQGLTAESFDGCLLHEPSRLKTGAGSFYKVYTPFWKALCSGPEPRDPVDAPDKLVCSDREPKSEKLKDWNLLPEKPDWAGGLCERWNPGEEGAWTRLDEFLETELEDYAEGRDRPSADVTSGLSPHLAHGEITPFQILAALKRKKAAAGHEGREKFRKELGWREFCYHLLFHNPDLYSKNFNSAFDGFSWSGDPKNLLRWQRGRTGYPIVDAGMRELWTTGVMHNRVRMIVASFLIKDCLIDWREGEKWFWDTLVDADPASNPANWQWVAGSGADASPYFRIFNPILQGEKFDPEGIYVRRFIPALAKMPSKYIHRPWEAPKEVLAQAGVKLGSDYPVPVIDHREARELALKAYKSM